MRPTNPEQALRLIRKQAELIETQVKTLQAAHSALIEVIDLFSVTVRGLDPDSPTVPQYGSVVKLAGEDGEPDGRLTKVKLVKSEDAGLFEIVDVFNQTYIIEEEQGEWIEYIPGTED